MKIKETTATILNRTAKIFLLWEERLMTEPAAIIPKTNLPKVKSVGKATWLSLLFAGAGQIYLGQIKKGWLLIVLSILGLFAIIVPGVIIIIIGMIDANVIAKRIRENGSVNEWEFFWNRKAKSVWKVLKIEPIGYSEKFIGSEPRRYLNAKSSAPVNHTFRGKKEWTQSYSIEKEKAHSTTSVIDPKITDSAIISRSIQDVFREKYSYAENKKIVFEEDVTVSVPPWKNIQVDLIWKYIIENWMVILTDQYNQQIEFPVSFIAKLTFDQRQFEFDEKVES
jgi:TM2 domain-containing membrane protein YozV